MGHRQGRHRRVRTHRRVPRSSFVAAPAALVATAAAVALGLQGAGAGDPGVQAGEPPAMESAVTRQPLASRGGARSPAPDPDARALADERMGPVERALRPSAIQRAVRRADERRWTTTELNIWSRPDERAAQLGVLDERVRVRVTGRRLLGRVEIVVKGKARWVTLGYLADEKPPAEPSVGGACLNGTSVPSGVSSNIVAIHQAVCANFPEIGTYGTLRGDGEHAQGIAMDIMVSGDTGWQVAEFLRANSSSLGVSYVIHARQIWSVQRGGEGWRAMADRGSVTANHYDHVHVTTF